MVSVSVGVGVGVVQSGGHPPCPFTLVQGPPGTGKTHTVWGLLNVLHFVHFQVRAPAPLRSARDSKFALRRRRTTLPRRRGNSRPVQCPRSLNRQTRCQSSAV